MNSRAWHSRAISTFKQLPFSIKTSQLAQRKTGSLILDNGLKAFVVSDPKTPTSSAALGVEAGSWHDGKFDGSAHFLEHMLFLGTAQYPSETDYGRYISDANGKLNGYTANDHSLYYFDSIAPTAFDGALDRFSRFFYQPLFNPSCINREMNAVDEEYRKNIESDGWRMLHVKKELATKGHPFKGFNTGNLETMKLIDQDYLKSWFARHYTAGSMNLVMYGKESVEDLKDMASRHFSLIPKTAEETNFEVRIPLFPESLKQHVVWIDPIKDIKNLTISWEIDYTFTNLESKPTSLVSMLLGHEGPGSLLALLKSKGLVENLSAGHSVIGARNTLFEISVSLTDAGLAHWESVTREIYNAVDSFTAKEFPKSIYDDSNHLSKLAFEYQQRSASVAKSYCEALRLENVQTFPYYSVLIDRFDNKAIKSLLSSLTRKDSMITILAKSSSIKFDLMEKWMFAKYTVFPFSLNVTSEASSKVQLPAKNPYIPTNLALIQHASFSDIPQSLIDSSGVQLLHFPDDSFQIPESSLMFNIKMPCIRPGDAKTLCLASIYNRFATENLNQHSYDASVAGLNYNVFINNSTGVAIHVDGYSEKALILWESILGILKSPILTKDLFEVYKSRLSRGYHNAAKNSPMQQAADRFSNVVLDASVTAAQMAAAVDCLQYEELLAYADDLFKERIIEAFVGGNTKPEDAIRAMSLLEFYLPGKSCDSTKTEPAHFLKHETAQPRAYSFEANVAGNALYWNQLIGQKSDELRSGVDMFSKLVNEPFYSELRTQQQTGYIVSSGTNQVDKHLFLNASIQSNTYDARDLLSRVEIFMATFVKSLKESKDLPIRFETIKAATIARLQQPHDRMVSKQRFYNYLAFEEHQDYGLLGRRIEHLKAYEYKDLVEFSDKFISNAPSNRIAVLANGNSLENKKLRYADYII